jgi:hypothetical protein
MGVVIDDFYVSAVCKQAAYQPVRVTGIDLALIVAGAYRALDVDAIEQAKLSPKVGVRRPDKAIDCHSSTKLRRVGDETPSPSP